MHSDTYVLMINMLCHLCTQEHELETQLVQVLWCVVQKYIIHIYYVNKSFVVWVELSHSTRGYFLD